VTPAFRVWGVGVTVCPVVSKPVVTNLVVSKQAG
jgi:hypothetical protein